MKSKLVLQDRRARSTSQMQTHPGHTANQTPFKVATIEARRNCKHKIQCGEMMKAENKTSLKVSTIEAHRNWKHKQCGEIWLS